MSTHPILQGANSRFYGLWRSPLGTITVATNGTQLTGVWFEGQSDFPKLGGWELMQEHPVISTTIGALDRYFGGDTHAISSPQLKVELAPHGTVFECAVWAQLCHIKTGQLDSYGSVAHSVGKPTAARAVGRAVGLNPISIIIPCHRVVGSTQALTGYAGGMQRKRALLKLEGIATSERKVLLAKKL